MIMILEGYLIYIYFKQQINLKFRSYKEKLINLIIKKFCMVEKENLYKVRKYK